MTVLISVNDMYFFRYRGCKEFEISFKVSINKTPLHLHTVKAKSIRTNLKIYKELSPSLLVRQHAVSDDITCGHNVSICPK